MTEILSCHYNSIVVFYKVEFESVVSRGPIPSKLDINSLASTIHFNFFLLNIWRHSIA